MKDEEKVKNSMWKKDINDKLVLNLRDLSYTMRALYEGKGSQKRILILLSEAGITTQRKLTKRLGIKPGSASEVIGKLENAGLIVRTPSKEDKRTADITLTEKGKALALDAIEQRQRRHEEMFSCLSELEKTELLSFLEKINKDWEERYGDTREKKEKPIFPAEKLRPLKMKKANLQEGGLGSITMGPGTCI